MSHKRFTLPSPGDPPALDLSAVLAEVERYHLFRRQASCMAVLAGFDAGRLLIGAKRSFPHGQWIPALERAHFAAQVGVSVKTCQRYMQVAETLMALPDSPALAYAARPSKTTRASFLMFLHRHKLTSLRRVLAMREGRDAAPITARARTSKPATPIPGEEASDHRDDWLTPDNIMHCAVQLFGEINLDPCGAADPDHTLMATRTTISPPRNGLAGDVPWQGRIFVHPPASNRHSFVERSVAAFESAEAEEILLLLPAELDAPFAARLDRFAKGFLQRRPTFATPTAGEMFRPTLPYMFVFLTRTASRIVDFAAACRHVADVYLPARALAPRTSIANPSE